MLHLGAEVGTGLHDRGELVSEGQQIVDDVRAVTEELVEELPVGDPPDGPVQDVPDSVQRVDVIRFDRAVQQPGDRHDEDQAREHAAQEQCRGQRHDDAQR